MCRIEPFGPGLMSFTSSVPAIVRSLFHSSSPRVPSLAGKYHVEPIFTESVGKMPSASKTRFESNSVRHSNASIAAERTVTFVRNISPQLG